MSDREVIEFFEYFIVPIVVDESTPNTKRENLRIAYDKFLVEFLDDERITKVQYDRLS